MHGLKAGTSTQEHTGRRALPQTVSHPGLQEAKSAGRRRRSAVRRPTFNRFSKTGKARIVASARFHGERGQTAARSGCHNIRHVRQLALASRREPAPTHAGRRDVNARPKKIRGHTRKPNRQKPHSRVTPTPGGSPSSIQTSVTQTSPLSHRRPQSRKPRTAGEGLGRGRHSPCFELPSHSFCGVRDIL